VLAVLIVLPMVGIDLTMLSVFGGALGVGLGLGLQKIASNYVSGFIILLDHSIRIGNTIAVGNDRGVVTSITTRYTVLKNATGLESLVPNECWSARWCRTSPTAIP
jgi:small-conductance mechanosensitive channel